MPTTYAHDAFGRKVYRQLPEGIRNIIHRHVQLYRIGLHGPDILFYRRVRVDGLHRLGAKLHREEAAPFFERGLQIVQKEESEALLVYLLGFACHFMLDSTCHPYIYQIEEEVSHTHIEKEMDRRLMEEDGLDPLHYFPARGIIPSRANAAVISKMFPETTPKQILLSLRGMRRITALMVYGSGFRHRIANAALKLARIGHHAEHFMNPSYDPECESYLEILDELFQTALTETPAILEALYFCGTDGGGTLPERFRRNYR